MIIMIIMNCADLIWVATALLTQRDPGRTGFPHEEIRRKVYEIEPEHGFTDSAVRSHITSHCVANKKPDPGKHRKLFRNSDGTYRLYKSGDQSHPGRHTGKLAPQRELLPPKYRPLIDWYESAYAPTPVPSEEDDPILSLAGVGKEIWESLGGGEKFIGELRENWHGIAPTRETRRKKAV
ncbi:MAG TPA: hypothetical protein VKU01_20415 [Bryobacteraceae bacterium]|nr:hypothetical protein [Bryobacteraceae bacterium]